MQWSPDTRGERRVPIWIKIVMSEMAKRCVQVCVLTAFAPVSLAFLRSFFAAFKPTATIKYAK